jgi:hypothetical protein
MAALLGVSAHPLDTGLFRREVVPMQDWEGLARLLLDAMGDGVAERGCPMWVRVLDPPDSNSEEGFALAFSDEQHGLLGWVAPPDCQAVGLVATGRIRALPGTPPGLLDPSHDRLRMACLVTRHGKVAWKVASPDGSSDGAPGKEAPSEGRLLDCLRRCFALPTPPAPVSPARLQAIAWLVAVLERVDRGDRRVSWSDVSRLHPLAQIVSTDLTGPRSYPLPALSRLAGSTWTWEDLRRQAESNASFEGIVPAGLAGWMDEGMFARWVLSELPSADELLSAVRPYLAPSAARRLTHAVRASGLSESAPI